jgi:DNA invertase Pin-like site-specific DNA recombinase
MAKAGTVRCAVYTRKSSEEGLEQAFNSLDAQREACEAYIKSQVGEGWICLKAPYDDGGISGGTMERSALKRLLADIAQGQIDCVVVYKVDRLTRSLADFAKIIEAFDAKSVSFVSVTQAFNTTSSMGRLTLNVLLSFAQFEREVTGERIRDKIAASKKKGMWMGGVPPLGYDIPTDRSCRALVVNPIEAEVVRDIFHRYLRLKSVNLVRDELARCGVRSKVRTTQKGKVIGGCAFNTGSLFHLLQCRAYVGEIVHKTERYPGVHQAIVEPELFEAVQAQLALNARVRKACPTKVGSLPLRGLIFDCQGNRMSPTFAYAKSGKRHAYYVSSPVQRAVEIMSEAVTRLAARPFEQLVLDRLAALLARPDADWTQVTPLIQRVDVGPEAVRISLDADGLISGDQDAALGRLQARVESGDHLSKRDGHTLQLIVGVRPVFRGGRTWMVRPHGVATPAVTSPDHGLIKALAQAHHGMAKHNAAPTLSPAQWRQASSVQDSYLRRLMGAAFLAPDIQLAILEGRHPAGLTALQMINTGIPLAWADQRRALGFSHEA